MVKNIILVVLSFFSTLGFAVGFRIRGRNLPGAGCAGALTRIILIFVSGRIEERFLYMLISAFAASLYGEILARIHKAPSTYFIYPAIVPLIPGDLFFYFVQALFAQNFTTAFYNGFECLKALLGMSMGFVISSTVMHYIHRRNLDRLALDLIRPAAVVNQQVRGKIRRTDDPGTQKKE